MREQYDVHEIREKVDMYFDKELSQEDEKNFMHDIEVDPNVNRVFHEQQHFRDFIKQNVHRPTVTPDFINAIKKQIKLH